MGLTDQELLIHSTLRHGLTPQNALTITEAYQFHKLRQLHDDIHDDAIPGQVTVTDHFHAEADVKIGDAFIAQAGEVIEKCDDHKPIQHRDGKPAWCRNCGLTSYFQLPESNMDKRK